MRNPNAKLASRIQNDEMHAVPGQLDDDVEDFNRQKDTSIYDCSRTGKSCRCILEELFFLVDK